jgi:hypothetical protein
MGRRLRTRVRIPRTIRVDGCSLLCVLSCFTLWAGTAQPIKRLAAGWKTGVQLLTEAGFLSSLPHPGQLWSSPNLLFNWYHSSLHEGKAVGAWRWKLTSPNAMVTNAWSYLCFNSPAPEDKCDTVCALPRTGWRPLQADSYRTSQLNG